MVLPKAELSQLDVNPAAATHDSYQQNGRLTVTLSQAHSESTVVGEEKLLIPRS